jgi:phenylpyruvate tautomerase PptA (4-oxalocrotonate tautomerase family)
MPLVEITVPAGFLPGPEKQTLIKELTTAVLKAEGVPDSARARLLTWILIHEAARGSWAIAGEPPADLRFLVRVTVPVGAVSLARKRRMGLEIHRLLSKTAGKTLGFDEAWIIVQEVPDGHWTADGKILQLKDLTAFVGLKLPPKSDDKKS